MADQISLNVSTSYLFKDRIDKIWKIFTEKETFVKIFGEEMDSFQYKKGKEFIEGTEFCYRWKDMLYVDMKIEKIIDNEHYKMIKFYGHRVFPIDIKFRVAFHFFWNTVEETTYYIHEVICEDQESLLIYNHQNNEGERFIICKRVEKILFENFQSLNQTESILINLSLKKIWNIITDWRIFKLFVPNIAEDVEYFGDPRSQNTEMKITNQSKKNYNKLRVIKSKLALSEDISDELSSKKSEYVLHCYFGIPRCPLQNLIFNIVEVDSDLVYLSFKHEFLQPVKYELIKAISIEKKNILMTLKNSVDKYEELTEKFQRQKKNIDDNNTIFLGALSNENSKYNSNYHYISDINNQTQKSFENDGKTKCNCYNDDSSTESSLSII